MECRSRCWTIASALCLLAMATQLCDASPLMSVASDAPKQRDKRSAAINDETVWSTGTDTSEVTSRCSTGSESQHRCCHLPQKIVNIDRTPDTCTPLLYNELGNAQKLSFPLGDPPLPSNTWIVAPTQVHAPNGISISSAVLTQLVGYDKQTTLHR